MGVKPPCTSGEIVPRKRVTYEVWPHWRGSLWRGCAWWADFWRQSALVSWSCVAYGVCHVQLAAGAGVVSGEGAHLSCVGRPREGGAWGGCAVGLCGVAGMLRRAGRAACPLEGRVVLVGLLRGVREDPGALPEGRAGGSPAPRGADFRGLLPPVEWRRGGGRRGGKSLAWRGNAVSM